MNLDSVIRKVPNFPKPGILFYDVTSIFATPAAFRSVIDAMVARYEKTLIDGIVAIESRGFMIGGAYAYLRSVPLVLARKKGKLPGRTIEESYSLEYGQATLQIHQEDLPANKRWLIVDDLIATGGTIEAVAKMIERQQSQVAGVFAIIGLPFLDYSVRIGKYHPVTLIDYHGE